MRDATKPKRMAIAAMTSDDLVIERCRGRMAALFALVLTATLIGGCAAPIDDRRSGDTVTVTLNADPRNAGQVGSAVMGPQGDRTLIVLNISGVPPSVVRPVQLYVHLCGVVRRSWRNTRVRVERDCAGAVLRQWSPVRAVHP